MWFSFESIQAAQERLAGVVQGPVDATILATAKKRAELEKEILDRGKAICAHCGEEIWNNPAMYSAGFTWESESMLGWCDKNVTKKHQPKIELKEEDNS